MKTHEISRFTGTTAGNHVATNTNANQDSVEKAVRAFYHNGDLSSDYDPEREFRLFNHVVLAPMALVAVNGGRPLTDLGPDGTGEEFQGLSEFESYKANLKNVVRPEGSFGQVVSGYGELNIIFRVPPEGIPDALQVASTLQFPIRAIVCDTTDGLDIWVKHYWAPKSWFDADMDDLLLTMRAKGIKGKVCDERSQWLIPGSMPADPSNPKSLRRRLLFATDRTRRKGLKESLNLLSGNPF
jgi:hypothetical protein